MKILCPIDDSDHARLAVAFAARITAAFDATLTLLVVNWIVGGPARIGAAAMWSATEIDNLLSSASHEVKAASGRVPAKAVVVAHEPADAIIRYARENSFDHIVIGAGGKNAVDRFLFGSISREVLARAHCPVTLAR